MTPMFSHQLLDHFQNPRNPGEVENPDAVAQQENPVCGDVLRLTARIAEGRIADIRFKAKGCVPAMACGSAVTELVRGRSLAQARAVGQEELVAAVGAIPDASAHAVHLAIETLRVLLRTRMKQ
jgi:nitrogen fixation NifU-like protein